MEAKHIKTGKLYSVINDNVTNCTNAHDGQRMVLYQDKDSGRLFVRDWGEFQLKFEVAPLHDQKLSQKEFKSAFELSSTHEQHEALHKFSNSIEREKEMHTLKMLTAINSEIFNTKIDDIFSPENVQSRLSAYAKLMDELRLKPLTCKGEVDNISYQVGNNEDQD